MRSIFKNLNPQSGAFLIVMALAVALLMGLGIALETSQQFFSRCFVSLGGSALGVSLSLCFVRIFEPSQLGTLINVFSECNRSSILGTDEKHYSQLRKRLHGYLRSHNEDVSFGHDVDLASD